MLHRLCCDQDVPLVQGQAEFAPCRSRSGQDVDIVGVDERGVSPQVCLLRNREHLPVYRAQVVSVAVDGSPGETGGARMWGTSPAILLHRPGCPASGPALLHPLVGIHYRVYHNYVKMT
jgi:hypothetical protein